MEESKVIREIAKIKGITSVKLLEKRFRERIKELEEGANSGIFDVLDKNKVLVLTHDEKLRGPGEDIVLFNKDKLEFPSIEFPEAKGISASPGWKVHEFLGKRLNFRKGDASILLGLDRKD